MEAAVSASETELRPGLLGMTTYQWTVLFAAWLGWGFDIFDGLLFNYVAPNCVPTLLHVKIGSPEARQLLPVWTGALTAVLLLSWAAGGVLFGYVADRIGRVRTLMLTMMLYAIGTACCAFAPNIWVLMLFRVVSGLGIGGEWAAGASMVAEVVPERRRVEAGALLYTSAPVGLFLATFTNAQIAGNFFKGQPEVSWRYVFLCSLIPAAVALLVRVWVKEPERWQAATTATPAPRLRDLFLPQNRRLTISGLAPSLTALITWWSCNAFIPLVSTDLAQTNALAHGLNALQTQALKEQWKVLATGSFNWGGLLGTLLTIPAAKYLGRRNMFGVYFLFSALALFATFGLDLPPETRLRLYFFIGLTVFGVFGSFTFYLPELFPTRLRATGAGFCYNIGRVVAAGGPFWVGQVASHGSRTMLQALFYVGFVPLCGLFFLPWIIETRSRTLTD
jgi:MFS family permease